MNVIETSIRKPVTVVVGVILVALFGFISLRRMPYQLSPDVSEPEITVTTTWRGATPYEVERDIVEEQEKVLKGIPGLVEMESTSANGIGTITLRFKIGTPVDNALLRVSNKINEVPSYPENVDKPVISATGASTSPAMWMILKADADNPQSIYTYRTFFENEIRQYLERVDGVADLFIGGGLQQEMHVITDPKRLAAHDVTIAQIINVLGAENVNVSAGDMDVGRRDFRIRTVAEFNSPDDIEKVVIKSDGQHIVTVGDVADVQIGYEKLVAPIIYNGEPGIVVGIKSEPGVNVLDLSDRLEAVVKKINEEKLKPQKIHFEIVYDERTYIRGAISLVRHDILLGGALAIAILLIFLQSFSPTVVVTTAIPISILGTFIFMFALGRNLNVVSLAGISFAVGMLVDDAIVVLDNIDRHRKKGKSPFAAAYEGTAEVWGAVLTSTMTRVAVFLPVVFLQQEAGQLFRDIAIAVSCSVMLSLVVSVSVIPMLSKQLFSFRPSNSVATAKPRKNIFKRLGDVLLEGYMYLVGLVIRNTWTRIATVVILTSSAALITILLFPKMEYLPQGNRNFIINLLVPPPGLSVQERQAIGEHIFNEAKPYLQKDYQGLPGIGSMFYVGSDQIMLFGAISTHEQRAGELVPLFMRIMNSIPGIYGVSMQPGIFQTRLGRGRTINVDVSGSDINQLVQVGGALFGIVREQIPGAQVRPVPSLELLYPEVKLGPSRERLRAVGMNATDLGVALDVLMDGRKVADFSQEGKKKIDLVLKASQTEVPTPEALYDELLYTPRGEIMPVSSIAQLVRTTGMTQIRHLERNRTITLEVTPPLTITIQEAMETIQRKIIPSLKAQGMLKSVDVSLSGTADKLTEARKALQWNFFLAAIIIYLLMAALYENFFYPFIIMFSVPLAAAGGFIGLKLVNIFIAPQALDILTMLGFVILIGVVTNNAILIVHQALNNIRFHGMDYRQAVIESTRTRLRPIYMSSLTAIFGLVPLVLVPGPGSEMYRGLGSVVLAGLALSTVFTIFLIPALLMFLIKFEKPHSTSETAPWQK
jgi:HAE1 family hydrophobic/amphiphilic exporter-1